jgi:hypothetical protein
MLCNSVPDFPSFARFRLWLWSPVRFGDLCSLKQANNPVQTSRDRAQLPGTAYQRPRERLTEYALGGNHLHFFRTLVDCAPEAPQLKNHIGTVDLENLVLIPRCVNCGRSNGTLSPIAFNHERDGEHELCHDFPLL